MTTALPRMYTDLAGWFHLISAPDNYAQEAAAYRDALLAAAAPRPRTLLELGAGAGSNAFHLKRDFECTLTDLSPSMLALSRGINPECEHLVGDMRSLRLGRTFDAVFVHDALTYMTSEQDLRQAIETAHEHCRPGGAALFAPDDLRERFTPSTEHGGHDGDGRAARYLEWWWDPDPDDTTFVADYVLVLREGRDEPRVVLDRHVCGLFPRATWIRLLEQAGFEVHTTTRPRDDDGSVDEVFVGVRRG